MNVLLIYPQFPDTYWSFKHALKFVGKKVTSPPLGLLTVAALLPAEWNKKLIDMNASQLNREDIQWADMVMISAMIVQQDYVRSVIQRVIPFGKTIVAGGPLFTAEPEKFPEIDHLILNEAEVTLPLFLSDFLSGAAKHIYSSQEFPDITTTPIPVWNLLDMKNYDSMSIQYSRGCPFNCEFCDVTILFGHRPRTKSATQLVSELDQLYSMGWRRNIFFVDDNFIGNKRQLKEKILPALIKWRLDKTGCLFLTEASINLADDDELIQLMVQAGFHSVFIGIETPDEMSLGECNKVQNQNRDLLGSIKKLQRAGLQVMGGFIVGFDNDIPSIFERQINFIQESGILTAMVGLLNALPGTALHARLQKEGRILEESSGDNVDGHTNFVTRMDPDSLQKGYRHILTSIYSPELFYKRIKTFLTEFQPEKPPVTLEVQEILALFRAIWKLGILGRERRQFWDLVIWVFLKDVRKFPLAITFSIYGYHFRRITEEHLKPLPRRQFVSAPVQKTLKHTRPIVYKP
jgi:radical SAM superfamily enzyme YgiQ (UPF0313 family)